MNPLLNVQMLVAGYAASRCLHVVAELGVADALAADAPATAAQLAQAVGADARSLARVLRLLAANDVFRLDGDEVAHNAASLLLRSDHPQSLRAFARMLGFDFNWRAFEALEDVVRGDRPAREQVLADGIWDYYSRHPDQAAIFNAAMTGKTHAQIPGILRAFDFSGYRVIGDIGGGRGHLLRAVLDTAPAACGILFDLPHVIAADPGLASDRLQLAAGDFFADPLPACDLYLLMEVIHDWDDDKAAAIFTAVRKAAPPGARVLLIEEMLSGEPGPEWAKTLDVLMLGLLGGRQRTRDEYRALFEAAGLRFERSIPAVAGTTLIEAVAP